MMCKLSITYIRTNFIHQNMNQRKTENFGKKTTLIIGKNIVWMKISVYYTQSIYIYRNYAYKKTIYFIRTKNINLLSIEDPRCPFEF